MPENPWAIIAACYLVVINFVAAIVTISDKSKAQCGYWRVKERTLLLLCALGGSVGMYFTMRIIRHKTRKLKFMLGIPLIFFAELSLVIGLTYLASHGWRI